MKKVFLKYIFGIMLIVLLADPISAQTKQSKPAAALPSTLTTHNDSLQYTLGAYLGQWVNVNGFAVTNSNLFLKGLNDVLANKALLVPAETVSVKLDSYKKRLISAKGSQQEASLFAGIRGKTGVGMLPSGVGYLIMKNGTGFRPQVTDSVLLHVKGFLPDGKLFEDTYTRKSPLRGVPANFIPGLSEVLQIMPVGSSWKVFIPASLAYAEKGVNGLVPPYSALIFEIELLNAARSN